MMGLENKRGAGVPRETCQSAGRRGSTPGVHARGSPDVPSESEVARPARRACGKRAAVGFGRSRETLPKAGLWGYGAAEVNLFDVNFLFASLIWGSVGVGYFIYGRRQRSIIPLLGGVLMITASYFAGSALIMTLICVGLMAAVYFLLKQGY